MTKSMLMAMVAAMGATFATPAAIARDSVVARTSVVPASYEALRAGRTADAVTLLSASADGEARDPSRLINLGTALARLGRADQAAAMFNAAIDSPTRYDVELANGTNMDSRWAARVALERLERAPRFATVTLVEHR